MYLAMSQNYDHDLLFLLHDVARLIRVEADKRARGNGMTRAQWGIMLRLEKSPGLSQKEIADLLEVEPISVGRLVDRMAANGLVERRPDRDDRRVWRLHLTPAATGMLDQIHQQRAALAAQLGEGISPAARETMVQSLLRIKQNIVQPAAAGPIKEIA
jgi:DNA-binding MarR family transcriptional regulator